MSELIMDWKIYLGAFFVFSVIFNLFYKLAIKDSDNLGAGVVILQLIASAVLLLLTPFFEFKFSLDFKVYLFLFLAIIFYTLNDRIQASARKHLQVSTYSIIAQSSKVFLVVYGILIFHEPLVITKLLGAGLIILGNVLLLYQKGTLVFNRYMFFNLLASLFLATALTIDIGISKSFNLPFYIAITLFVPALLIFFLERISLIVLKDEFSGSSQKYYVIAGIAWGLVAFLGIRALQLGKVSEIAPLLAVTVLFNVIAGYLFLKERNNAIRKFLAVAIVFIGVFLIVSK